MTSFPHAADVAALGRRIHDERAARGFSLQEFAMLSGLTAPVLSALERGEESASLGAVFAAAEALDVPAASLFTGPGVSAPAEAAPRRIAEAPRTAPAAPRDYVPLEVPDLWEPPAPAPVAFAPVAPVAVAPPAMVAPVASAPVAPRAASAPLASAPLASAPVAPAPRTFADLRVGPLAGRTFATLREFAVAAVVEAGHAIGVVASLFRVPAWRLETWIAEAAANPKAKPARR